MAETDALGATQTYAYDPVGRMTAVTDALGNGTKNNHNKRTRNKRNDEG